MDRHADWAVIVCLVGGGQEINAGEAGLTEWFSALKRSFQDWKVYTSEQLAHRDYHWGLDLSAMLQGLEPECVYCAMFSCRPSMYFQPPPLPLSSPQSVSQAVTSK